MIYLDLPESFKGYEARLVTRADDTLVVMVRRPAEFGPDAIPLPASKLQSLGAPAGRLISIPVPE
jgi:hypothetical protein